jgi:hypothetical protein
MEEYYEGLTARLRQGLDGREIKWLAERVPWHYNQVQGWISGKVKPPAEFLAAYVRETGVSARWLLTGEGEMKRIDPSTLERKWAELRRIMGEGG